MRAKLLFSSWLVFAGCNQLLAQEILVDHRGDHYRRLLVFLPSERFTAIQCETLSRQYLGRPGAKDVIQVRFLDERSYEKWASKPSHVPYDGLVHLTSRIPNQVARAEMIAIGDDAVLRFRGNTGKFTHKVLRGRDPLIGKMSDREFRIQWMEFWEFGQNTEVPGATQYNERIDVFSTVSSSTQLDDVVRLFQNLSTTLRNVTVNLYASESGWFPFQDWQPLVNPFLTNFKPPSATQYSTERRFFCSGGTKQPDCRAGL